MAGFNRLLGKTPGGMVLPQGPGDNILNPVNVTQSADSNQTISAAAITGGLYSRTGMTAGRTDTTDTAVNILAQMPGMDIGDSFLLMISNVVAFALTLAGGTGVTLGTKTTIPASGFGFVRFVKTSDTTLNAFVL